MSVREREREELKQRSETFNPNDFEYDNPDKHPANLEPYYGSLRNYVRMVVGDYANLLMLDAKGGLGKTHNVSDVLNKECGSSGWTHLKGFTTPVELYKTLWAAQGKDHILFLDDMSGVTNNTKAIDMLKAATDTNGDENWVEYRSSRGIDHPVKEDEKLPQTFCFRGRIIMSFNDTPDNEHFNALKDRGTFYNLDFSYSERLELIREIAKLEDFSDLSVREQQETAEWIASVTDTSMDVSIRTFENVCQMRHFGQQNDEPWERMALEVFSIDHEKYLIIRMREHSDLPVGKQVEHFERETGRSESYYYNLLSEIKSERMN